MTVGCVISTVPRRNSVNQAVVAETASASTAIETATGSVTEYIPLSASPNHGAGITITHGCSFFVLAAVSRHVAKTFELAPALTRLTPSVMTSQSAELASRSSNDP